MEEYSGVIKMAESTRIVVLVQGNSVTICVQTCENLVTVLEVSTCDVEL